jgi:hypothetical protein
MKITNSEELELAIKELEQRSVVQQSILSSQLHATYESLKPMNLIKSAFHKITAPGDTRSTILKAAGGLGAGLLAKKFLIGKSSSMIGSFMSNALKVTAANKVIGNADKIKAYGIAIFNNLFRKKN